MNKKEKLWSKHWISAGIRAVHESHLHDDDPLIMTVDHLIRRSVQLKNTDGTHYKKRMVVGVACHWFDKNREYRQGRFNTNEIYPAEIVKEKKLDAWAEEVLGTETL